MTVSSLRENASQLVITASMPSGDAIEFLAQAGANSISTIGSQISSAMSSAIYSPSSSSSFVGEDYKVPIVISMKTVYLSSKPSISRSRSIVLYRTNHILMSTSFMKRYKGRLLAASDVLTPKDDVTDTCEPRTHKPHVKLDECRWDSTNSKCLDPILTTYNLATASDAPTITRGHLRGFIVWNFNRFTVVGLLMLPQPPSICVEATRIATGTIYVIGTSPTGSALQQTPSTGGKTR